MSLFPIFIEYNSSVNDILMLAWEKGRQRGMKTKIRKNKLEKDGKRDVDFCLSKGLIFDSPVER